MLLSNVRDLVRTFLSQFGVKEAGSIPKAYIDTIINAEMQSHFQDCQSYHKDYHTTIQANLEEYQLPAGLLSPYTVKVAGERYYPQRYPIVNDSLETDSTVRTRVTADGQTVDSRTARWYWIRGGSLFIYPTPTTDTTVAVSGTITSAVNDVITIATGNLVSANYYRKRIITLDSTTSYVILNHSLTQIVIDGTLAGTETTFDIYNKGLDIEGTALPPSLTVGSDDPLEGNDIDALAIASKTAYIISLSIKDATINLPGIIALHQDYKRRAKDMVRGLERQGAIQLTPYRLRGY
jgi:hypothetical protein